MSPAKLFFFILSFTSGASFADGLASSTNTMWPRGTAYSEQGYLEYLPVGYGARPLPLLIFLSGKGQSGPGTPASLDNLGNMGLAEEIKRGRWPTERPFVILTPQHVDLTTNPTADEVDQFIQFAKAHYLIDTNRIYITGMSRGARGVANYLAKYGGKDVAAAVPLAGDLTPAWAAQGCALAHDVGLFGAHGGQDQNVPIGPDREAFARFAECPDRRDVEYVIYEEAGHIEPFLWLYSTETDYDIFHWLLQFTKRSPGAMAGRLTGR